MDELLTDIAESGWLFNNCYQVDAALWRVSLRRPDGNGDWFSDWAEGSTLAGALHDCMAKLADAEWEEEREVKVVSGIVRDDSTLDPSGQSLLARLGLNKRTKVERRI
jgi:hypothetical protein